MLGEMGVGPLGVRANSRVWLPSGSVWPWKVQGSGSGSQYVLIDFGTHSSVFLGKLCYLSNPRFLAYVMGERVVLWGLVRIEKVEHL